MDDKIFKFGNLTDFEKLLFTERELRLVKEELKKANIEIGMLKSEIDELKEVRVDVKSEVLAIQKKYTKRLKPLDVLIAAQKIKDKNDIYTTLSELFKNVQNSTTRAKNKITLSALGKWLTMPLFC